MIGCCDGLCAVIGMPRELSNIAKLTLNHYSQPAPSPVAGLAIFADTATALQCILSGSPLPDLFLYRVWSHYRAWLSGIIPVEHRTNAGSVIPVWRTDVRDAVLYTLTGNTYGDVIAAGVCSDSRITIRMARK